MKVRLLIFCSFFISLLSFSQDTIDLKASFDIANNQIYVNQTIQYKNTSNQVLHTIYLTDWSNSYSKKNTPLGKRFAEEYKNDFHFAKETDRGATTIQFIKQNQTNLHYNRLPKQADIIKVKLDKPLQENQSYTLNLEYVIKLPNNKFTRYGITSLKNINLRYWYITPAVFNGKWHLYSNKDLNDAFVPKANLNFEISFPENYILTTELDEVNKITKDSITTVILNGTNRVNSKLFLNNSKRFNTVETDYFSIVTNIDDNKIQSLDRVLLTDKIASFIANNLGSYPHKRLLISNIDYKKNPIYGLNLLPDFIRPFPDSFQYELKLLKTALRVYLENTLMLNPRKEQWLIDGFQTYFLIKYVEENYPNMSIIGSFANIWGIKSFHAAKLKFNDQYPLMYMNMARDNLDQPLTMQKDSLLKFNKNIANPNKAAVGLRYLNSFDESISMDNAIKEFITLQKLKTTTTKDFKKLVKSKASKNIDWFFSDYLTTNKKIDFTVKKVEEQGDSILVHVKNKRGNSMPSALFLMQEDSVISKTWLHNFKDEKIIKLPKKDATKLVINKDHVTPEFNNRNNTKSLTGSLLNKPFQLRLIKDVEDSRYNQLFIMPIVEYNNIYDGLVLGTKAYNKTALRKDFNYKLSPQYATNSNTITGTGSFVYHQFFNNVRYLNKIQYTLTGSYESYAENLFVRTFKPNITFHLKDTKNLRLNKRQLLNLRFVSINRDKDLNNVLENKSEPNYNIFNLRFINYNPGMLNYSSWFADFQISNTFSKIGFNYEFRKLYQNNRQLNLRFFAGTFIKNKNDANSNYFSFALDRPTDYLFDYDYLGRSESNGLFSQQVIIAEGGFKSKLNKPFANQWMATANVSTSIWQYIHAYGDIGFLKNKNEKSRFVYDSGVRINLVEDYFEIYFPVYSNLGWEITQTNYNEKIRFKFTVDINSLLGLFRRRWY